MIDDNGELIVNQANLDRDPPNENRLSFQVFVRELVEDEPKSSRPVTVTVNLKDINDNAPILEAVPDISIVAGNTKRNIATVRSIKIFFITLHFLLICAVYAQYWEWLGQIPNCSGPAPSVLGLCQKLRLDSFLPNLEY